MACHSPNEVKKKRLTWRFFSITEVVEADRNFGDVFFQ